MGFSRMNNLSNFYERRGRNIQTFVQKPLPKKKRNNNNGAILIWRYQYIESR